MLNRLMLAMLLLGACRSCPKPSPPPVVPAPLPEIRIVKTWSACLEVPPPTAPAYAPLPGNETPSPCVACFLGPDAQVLGRYIADLETWAQSSWARCNKTTGGEK